VTDERTKTVVLIAAKGTLRSSVDSPQIAGPCTPLVVKYIAKSAAKNINSLDSQTIVPTATTLGLVILCIVGIVSAAVMEVIIPENEDFHLFTGVL
jgi:hypothetical protein